MGEADEKLAPAQIDELERFARAAQSNVPREITRVPKLTLVLGVVKTPEPEQTQGSRNDRRNLT
jgi:hypothetical protein